MSLELTSGHMAEKGSVPLGDLHEAAPGGGNEDENDESSGLLAEGSAENRDRDNPHPRGAEDRSSWKMVAVLLGLVLVLGGLLLSTVSESRPGRGGDPTEEGSDKIGEQTVTTFRPASLYYNLTCPFEWSKYSCVRHGERERAQESFDMASEHLANATFARASSLPRNILMVGDSTMRQVFIALGCLLLPLTEMYFVDWMERWPCHGTPNCIHGGNHSGFNVGVFKFRWGDPRRTNLTTVWFVPNVAYLRHGQPEIIKEWIAQLDESRALSFQLTPSHERVALDNHDAIVYNIGLETKDRSEMYSLLDKFGREVLFRAYNNSDNSSVTAPHLSPPHLVYTTTVTQHFQTEDGLYVEKNGGPPPGCVPSLEGSVRQQEELALLREGENVDRILVVNDLNMGRMHIGGKDCTHYCMPGVPDVTALELLWLLEDMVADGWQ